MAAAPGPDEVLRSSTGKANFQRVTRLLISGGITLLREIFDQIYPRSNLPTILKNPATEKRLKAAKLTKPQWDCLYPSPGVCGKSTDFDLTLLFKLLRTICNLVPPATGWDALPTCTDHSLAADLVRIKYYRNSVYGHVNQKMEITDDQFPSLWQEISEALVRIAGQISPTKKHEWQVAVFNFLKNPLTAEDERNVRELLDWYRNDMEVKESIEELKVTTQEGMERLEACLKGVKEAATKEVQEGTERLESSVLGGFEGATHVLERAVHEEAQNIKDQLKEELESSDKEFQVGIERLESSFQGRLEESAHAIETAVRGEAQDVKDRLGEMHQSINRLNSSPGGPHAGGARVRLRIDCETISGPSQAGGSSEELEERVQSTTVVPTIASRRRKRKAEATGVLEGVIVGNNSLPSPQEVLSSIALKVFEPVDPSKPEELNGFLEYMEKVRKVLIVDAHLGSLIITVECSSLKILDELWEDYCTGQLNEMAQRFLVTGDILREFGLTEVKLRTTISEEEYRACRDQLLLFLYSDVLCSPAPDLDDLK